MPLPLTLTPTGQQLAVPTSWADVPFGTFCDLLAPTPGEPRTAAELLLGLEAGGLNQLAASDAVYLGHLLDFASDPSSVLELPPPVGLPDVGGLPWGALVLVQQRLGAEPERPPLAHLPFVLAVYRCQLAHGSTDRVEQVLAAVLAAPCTEVYAEAQAFYSACRKSLSATPQTRATPPTTTSPSSTPAWRNWLSGLGRRFRSTPSPAGTC